MNPLEDDESLSRRGFLVGSVGVAAAAGVSTPALAQEDEDGENGNGEDEENGEDENGNGEEEEDAENGNGNGNGNGEDDDEDAGGAVETVAVVDNEFQPDSLSIEPGTTVQWVWEGDNHNVAPGTIPDESDWEGHEELEDSGFEYEYTFDVEGTYEYVCTPHVAVGMTAEIVVDPDAAGGGAGGPVDLVPDAAWTLVIATVAGMISTLSLVYFFMRYGGSTPEQA